MIRKQGSLNIQLSHSFCLVSMSFDPQEVLQHLQLAEQKLAQLPKYEKALNDANAKLHDVEKAYNQLKKSIDANAKYAGLRLVWY